MKNEIEVAIADAKIQIIHDCFTGKRSYEESKLDYINLLIDHAKPRILTTEATDSIINTVKRNYFAIPFDSVQKSVLEINSPVSLVTSGVISSPEKLENALVIDNENKMLFVYIHDFMQNLNCVEISDKRIKYVKDEPMYHIETVYRCNETTVSDTIGYTNDLNKLIGYYWRKFTGSGQPLYIQIDKESIELLMKNQELKSSYKDYKGNMYSLALIINEVRLDEFKSSGVDDVEDEEICV